MTAIEWTDVSWNPVFGCSKVSEGCRNCYAETMAKRLGAMGQEKYMHVTTNGKWNGIMSASDKVIFAPMSWKKPRKIFVNSMSDVFHENLPFYLGYHQKIFEVMLACPQHTFQLLTKRPERMREYLSNHRPWLDAVAAGKANHIWLGTSVENQSAADERIKQLLQTPAAVRFLSMEPLLGPVDLNVNYFDHCITKYVPREDHTKIISLLDWVIVGGESGPGARPMHPDWVRSLRDQCQEFGVPFFFKQWGVHIHTSQVTQEIRKQFSWNKYLSERDEGFIRLDKKIAGRELDGRTWDEFPEVKP